MRTTFRALLASISGRRRQIGVFFFSTLLVAGVFFLVPTIVHGADGEIDANGILENIGLLFANIALGLTEILGKLLLFVMDTFLVPIAGYNGFVTAPAVQQGWVIIRDLTNMFFVLMMLVISIGTILGIEEFSYRRLLPRLLIMAVLINFSKVIVGIFIDFSQVVMLTFVNGFSAAAGGNMIALFKLEQAVDISEGLPGEKLDIWDFVGAQFLGLLMIVIALMIVVVMCMMLAFRIVMLWILTILSPLVFFLSTVQKGKAQQAYAQWWDKLGTYLISGPVLAFFLWLAFSVSAGPGLTSNFDTSGEVSEIGTAAKFYPTVAGERSTLVGYIIGVAMLLGGMYITADFGAMGGSMLRSGADFVSKSAPRAIGRFAYQRTAGAAGRQIAAGAVATVGAAERGWFSRTGIYLPGSKRNEERKKQLLAQKEQQANTTGLLVRRERKFRPTQRAQEEATGKKVAAEGQKQRLDAVTAAQQALFAPTQPLKDRIEQNRNAVGADRIVMSDETRHAIEQRLKELDLALPVGVANTPEMIELTKMKAVANGEVVDWKANSVRADAQKGIMDRNQELEKDLRDEEERIRNADKFSPKGWRSLEEQRQQLFRPERQLREESEAADAAAQAARRDFARNPESRFLNAALAKAQSEAMDALGKNMNPVDRQNALRDAWDRGDKATFQLMMDKMAQEEELPDVMKDGVVGKKYGTDLAGLQAFAKDVENKFKMSQQETLRILSGAFGTASSKGQHIFRGRIATDLGSGAQRWNSEEKAAIGQARKIDTMSANEFWKKDNTPAGVVTDASGKNHLTEALIYKLAATQKKFVDTLQKNEVNQTMLQAMKENLAPLRAMQDEGVLDKATVDLIASTTVNKIASAQEIAKQRAKKV